MEGLSANLDQLKKQATSSNGQDVQLRALEREAKAQRDLRNPTLRNIAKRPRARISTPRRRTAGSFPAPSCPIRRPTQKVADRADRDIGEPDAERRRDRHRRIVAHDLARCGDRVRFRPRCANSSRRSRTRFGRGCGPGSRLDRNRAACRRSAGRRRRGAQGHHSRHRPRRQHHVGGAGAGPPDRAPGEGRGGRSGGGIAGDFGGLGRSGRTGPCAN